MLDVLLDLRLAAYRGGGIARYARELHAALATIPDINAVALRTRRDTTVDTSALRVRTPPHHRLELVSIAAEVALSRKRFNVYHATDFIAPHLPGTPSVATVHDLAFLDWPADLAPDALRYYRQLERSNDRTAAWITPSAWTADALADRYGIERESVHVIPHGVSLNLLTAPVVSRAERGDYILAVGTVEPRKQYDLLLDALELVPTLPRLIIAGAPGWNATATEQRLRASLRVTWEQNVTDARLRDLYRNALALAIPSRAEGFGLAALEAMATGTPVISSSGGALPEVTGTVCITVPYPSPEAWTGAIRALANDGPAWEALSSSGRERATRFTWRNTAELTASVYRSVARG